MTISSNAAGVACCGNCGHELVIACTGGCPEPDAVLRENYVAALPKPRGEEPRQEWKDQTPKPPVERKGAKYPPPTHCFCGEPVAQRARFGVGRPPTKCEKHVIRKKVAI